MCLSKKILVILVSLIYISSPIFSKPAEKKLPRQIQTKVETIKATKTSYYIRSASGSRCGKIIYGPFDNINQALCIWIFYNIEENKSTCIAINDTFKTKKPSETYKVDVNQLKDQITEYGQTAVLEYYFLDRPLTTEQENTTQVEQQKDNSTQVNTQENLSIEQSQSTPEQIIQTESVKPEQLVRIEESKGVISEEINTTEQNKENQTQEKSDSNITLENTDKEEKQVQVEKENTKTEELKTKEKEIELAETKQINETKNETKNETTFNFNINENSKTAQKQTQDNQSKYQKEYLQDYVKIRKVPLPTEEDNISTIKIDNPNQQDSNGVTLLMKACELGNNWEINALLNAGADVNLCDKDGWTALMYASRYQENSNVIITLLNAKADVKKVNNYDQSALLLAATYNSNPQILIELLKYYSASDKVVFASFIMMLSDNQTSDYSKLAKIQAFVDKSISINSFYKGKTPLMYACEYSKSTKIIKCLLDNGALTTIRSVEGKTAFDYAMENTSLIHDNIFWKLNQK